MNLLLLALVPACFALNPVTGQALALTPGFAAVQAMALIGERLAWYHGAAIVLVVAGLILIDRDQTR